MALNTAHAAGVVGGVLIYSGERILLFYDGVEMSFSDISGNMPQFKGSKKGRGYLTTHRVIFTNASSKDTLQSFAMPFYCMREVELEQPVFGANYIKGKVKAEPGGNWEGTGKFKMYFNKGGAIEFGQCMVEAGRRASRQMTAPPPPYMPPTGPYYQAPPPAYAPPQGPQYGFVPYETFPNAPPADSVYMMQAPPPYPGIDPNLPPYQPPVGAAYPPQNVGYPPVANGYPPAPNGYPQASAPMSAADAKAAEAGAAPENAYFNPANPHNVYMPQQPYPDAPPSYTDATKKDQ